MRQFFFPSVEVVGADHGGGASPADGSSLHALFQCRRRKKKAGWAEMPVGPTGCWADWAES
jgi:hypothetical protein